MEVPQNGGFLNGKNLSKWMINGWVWMVYKGNPIKMDGKWMIWIVYREHPIKMDDLGVPPFMETPQMLRI